MLVRCCCCRTNTLSHERSHNSRKKAQKLMICFILMEKKTIWIFCVSYSLDNGLEIEIIKNCRSIFSSNTLSFLSVSNVYMEWNYLLGLTFFVHKSIKLHHYEKMHWCAPALVSSNANVTVAYITRIRVLRHTFLSRNSFVTRGAESKTARHHSRQRKSESQAYLSSDLTEPRETRFMVKVGMWRCRCNLHMGYDVIKVSLFTIT